MTMRELIAHSKPRLLLIAAALSALTLSAVAQERDRSKVPDKYKWNLADLYPADADWRAAKDKAAAELLKLGTFKGKLASSPATLADALETMSALDKQLSRLYAYANMLADQDTRDSERQGMKQEMVQLYSAFGAEASYVEPEILRFPKGTIERFIVAAPRLKVYEFYLKDIERRAAHTLTAAEEKVLADAGPLAGAPSDTYGILANADLPFPTVTLSDGKAVKIDQAAFGDLRALPNRADREKVMSAFFNTLGSFNRTFGTTMNGEVQKVLFYSKERKYPSALAFSLDAANIPTTVYTRLVDGINNNLPIFHR
jgi:oligoendopeptidase F